MHTQKNNSAAFQNWLQRTQKQALSATVDKNTLTHLTFDDMGNGKCNDLAKGGKKASYYGNIAPAPGKHGTAIRSDAYGQFIADGSRISFERMEPFSISFWINRPKKFEDAHVMYTGNNRIQGYRGWDIVLDTNRVHFRLSHAHPYQSLDIFDPEALPLNEWVHYVWTYDGSSKAEGMQLYKNGLAIESQIQRDFLYRSTKPYTSFKGTVYMAFQGLVIGNRHYDQDFTGGLLDEVRILSKEADPFTASYLFNAAKGEIAFQDAIQKKAPNLKAFYDAFIDPQLESKRVALRKTQKQEVETIDTVQEIMIMGDLKNNRPTFVLERGIYDAKGKPVQSKAPQSILPWPEEFPKNRYGLGQWLIHPDHPLTARVAVNQLWYLFFGRGLVETVEDFGNQGALPSHPALLDWLALDFQQHNWDVKRLVRQLVLSATYRQSSKIRPELQDIDPNNYLLARGPRYRRSAEMVRDNILATSGLLNPNIGGPSVFPYQPEGLWKEVMAHTFFPEYQIDYDHGLYRRSIYTFWKRNMPPPSMLIFDAASRAECQMRRQQSSTPLQALVLLNDPQIIEGCRVLAENMWQSYQGDITNATSNTFRLLTSRKPTTREQAILLKQYKEELNYFKEDQQRSTAFLNIGKQARHSELPLAEIAALARVTNTVLNSTEAYYKN